MLFRHDGVCSDMTSDLMISILIGILRPAIHGALTGDGPPGAAGSLTALPPVLYLFSDVRAAFRAREPVRGLSEA